MLPNRDDAAEGATQLRQRIFDRDRRHLGYPPFDKAVSFQSPETLGQGFLSYTPHTAAKSAKAHWPCGEDPQYREGPFVRQVAKSIMARVIHALSSPDCSWSIARYPKSAWLTQQMAVLARMHRPNGAAPYGPADRRRTFSTPASRNACSPQPDRDGPDDATVRARGNSWSCQCGILSPPSGSRRRTDPFGGDGDRSTCFAKSSGYSDILRGRSSCGLA